MYVYAMFRHRNNDVSLVYVSYYGLLHRRWYDNSLRMKDIAYLCLSYRFLYFIQWFLLLYRLNFWVYANQRASYSLHFSSASTFRRILQAARWLAGNIDTEWCTARNRSLFVIQTPFTVFRCISYCCNHWKTFYTYHVCIMTFKKCWD